MKEPVRQSDDAVRAGPIAAIGMVAAAIFVLGAFAAVWLWRGHRGEQRQNRAPLQAEIGIVNQTQFDSTSPAVARAIAKEAELQHWGWIDRDAGIVHMPIGEAMRRMATGAHR